MSGTIERLAARQTVSKSDQALNRGNVTNKTQPENSRTSIIITCYNYAHFLPLAVTSALEQTLPAAEIIIVDDGSTDNTARVAMGFGERIRYIYRSNGGLSAARNTGIQSSTGEYFGLLDADDLWLPDFLKTLVQILDANPDFGAVYCGSQFIDAAGNRLSQIVTKTYPANELHNVLVHGAFFPPGAVLVRKSVVQELGLYDGAMGPCDDWDMWLRISARYPFGGTPEILALYRRHGTNMSGDLGQMRASQLAVVHKHFGPDEGDPIDWSPEKRQAYAGVYLWHTLAHYQRGEYGTAQTCLTKTFTISPDLGKSFDTFYMLACANQPPGYVGDLQSLRLDANAAWLSESLNTLFGDSTIPLALKSNANLYFGMAFFALGFLAYRKRELEQARSYLAMALTRSPGLITDSRWRSTFIKSLLGTRLFNTLVALRQ